MSDEEVDAIFHAMLMAEWELLKNKREHISDAMDPEEVAERNAPWN